ncbi:hypothetical protein E2C01_001476 [Portunus trituberculatus]|uniref:Uncharacterized protein n=1 Tax=Portunus trituberculatus TaxID=210409 RepID=A0A5B7CJD8_PORTR|nr:hypothetical protein [Portunus trituberculatus]
MRSLAWPTTPVMSLGVGEAWGMTAWVRKEDSGCCSEGWMSDWALTTTPPRPVPTPHRIPPPSPSLYL